MRGRPITRMSQPRLSYSRFLISPSAAAGSRLEPVVAALCITVLGAVFLVEFMTPDIVVGAAALLPLLAAVWLLSNRWLGLVGSLAVLFFAVGVRVEAANRISLALAAVVALLTALVVRLYARTLTVMLASHDRVRPDLPTQAMPPTLDQLDRFSYGVKSLTRREIEVARLGAGGYTTLEIAHQLHIGKRTVESHLASAYSKLRIGSRAELIRMAAKLGVR